MTLLVDPVYNPNFLNPELINSGTKLAPGVTIAKFLGAYGDRTSFNHIKTAKDRQQIARQLYLQAEVLRSLTSYNEIFKDIRIIISEGLYRGGPDETVGGDNLKKADGRLVVYQVIGRDGKIDHTRTFDLAAWWKDYINYEKLTLEYDTYNPDGSLTSQILVEMPTVSETFDLSYALGLETVYNGTLLSKNELVEVKLS